MSTEGTAVADVAHAGGEPGVNINANAVAHDSDAPAPPPGSDPPLSPRQAPQVPVWRFANTASCVDVHSPVAETRKKGGLVAERLAAMEAAKRQKDGEGTNADEESPSSFSVSKGVFGGGSMPQPPPMPVPSEQKGFPPKKLTVLSPPPTPAASEASKGLLEEESQRKEQEIEAAETAAEAPPKSKKELEACRRSELQALMRDKAMDKVEKKSKMDEVKKRYTKLIQEADERERVDTPLTAEEEVVEDTPAADEAEEPVADDESKQADVSSAPEKHFNTAEENGAADTECTVDTAEEVPGALYHDVQPTDTLNLICLKYKIKTADLRKANGNFKGFKLDAAPKRLVIPTSGGADNGSSKKMKLEKVEKVAPVVADEKEEQIEEPLIVEESAVVEDKLPIGDENFDDTEVHTLDETDGKHDQAALALKSDRTDTNEEGDDDKSKNFDGVEPQPEGQPEEESTMNHEEFPSSEVKYDHEPTDEQLTEGGDIESLTQEDELVKVDNRVDKAGEGPTDSVGDDLGDTESTHKEPSLEDHYDTAEEDHYDTANEDQTYHKETDEELNATIPPSPIDQDDELDRIEKQMPEECKDGEDTASLQDTSSDGSDKQPGDKAESNISQRLLSMISSVRNLPRNKGSGPSDQQPGDKAESNISQRLHGIVSSVRNLPHKGSGPSDRQPREGSEANSSGKLQIMTSRVHNLPRKRKIMIAVFMSVVLIAIIAGAAAGGSGKTDESSISNSSSNTREKQTDAHTPVFTPPPAESAFPYEVPDIRFTPFHKLDKASRDIAVQQLGYTEVTWNNIGLNPIELERWNDLSSAQRRAAREHLGLNVDTWDCFINHYTNSQYSWSDLPESARTSYGALGWTQSHWEGTATDLPASESKWWGQLSDDERKAANGVCYFKTNWNKMDMTENFSYFPYPVPEFRYKPWSTLDSVSSEIASSILGYTLNSWNNPGSNYAEENTFLNLGVDEQEGAAKLGFYTHTWDCHVNHYLSYYWSSFHDDLLVAVEALGWNEAMWTGLTGATPASEDKMWVDLTPEERAGATRLCYFQELWDGEPINFWYDYDLDRNTGARNDQPLPSDINLGIFETTGYVGKPPASVGR